MAYFSLYLVIIKNYFNFLHIQSVAMMICSQEEIKVNFMKDMSQEGFLISYSMQSVRDKAEVRTGAVLDISCTDSNLILNKMSKMKMFSVDIEWLLLEEVNTTGEFQKTTKNTVLDNLLILPGSWVTLAQFSSSENKIKLYEVYRVAMWKPMKYNVMAEFSLNNTIHFGVRKTKMSLEGVTLRAGSAILYPELFAGWESTENVEVDTNPKATYAVAKNVEFHLNFSFTLKFLPRYGYQTNGTFDGLMGYLQREELDISAVGLMMNDDRILAADFTGDIIPIRSPMIFRQPPLSTVSNIFLLPFEKTVWFLSGGVTLLFAFCLFLNLFLKMKLLGLTETDDSSIAEIISVTMAYVCQQGTGLELRPGAGRISLCILSMFCFFLSVSFSAKIVALLQSSAHTIKSLSHLANGPMTVGMQDAIYNDMIFAKSTDEEVKNLYKKKILPQGDKAILSADYGIHKLKLGLYAFKVETPWAYKLISETFEDKEKCDLDQLHVFLLPMISIAVQKKSGYREHVTRSISRQREVGIIQRTENFFYPQKPSCNSKALGYTSVKLADFKPVLGFIFYGFVISLMLFILEFIFKIRCFKKFDITSLGQT